MTDPTALRLDVGRLRRELDQGRRFLHDERARLTQLERELVIFGGEESEPGAQIKARIDAMRPVVEADAGKLANAEARLTAAQDAYDAAVATEPAVWPDGATVPLLLLPVRLEAVHSRVAGAAALLLRVYPDDVHVDAHEEGLTAAEREAGARYWDAVGAPGADEAARAAAWSALLDRLGPARAAWTLEALRPGAPEPATRPGTWTRAAHTTLLPDRFVFSAYTNAGNTELALAWRREGRAVPDTLKLGFAPPDQEGERLDRLPWDEESRWLVDFDAAVENGMGLVVPLPDPDVFYDLLTVVGVSTGLDARAGAARWQATLQAHQFGNGLAFVPTRTPTNNTPASRSGWMSRPEVRAPQEVDGQRAAHEPAGGQAAARAARAFGIDGGPVLAAAPNALGDDAGPDLARLHRAFGLFFNLSPLLRPYPPLPADMDEDTILPPDTALPPRIPLVLDHFAEHVRSRGTLPALRIGRQPYGVLPASSLDLWKGDEPDPRLIEHLRSVASTLESLVDQAPRVGVGEDQDSVILDLLSRVPASERMVDTQTRPVELSQTLADEPPNATVGSVPAGSRAEHFGLPEDSGRPPRRIAAEPPGPVRDVLATRPLATLLQVADERLAALAAAQFGNTVLDVLSEAQQAALAQFAEAPEPRGFHSIALRVFGDLEVSMIRSQRLLTAPEDASPGEPELLADAITRGRELAAALVELEPRAAEDLPGLDRLMLEVLDTVAHRVDAWITSLATGRLAALREDDPTGLRTGAYGWLTEVHDPGPVPPSDGYILTPSLQHAATAAVLRSGWQAHSDKQALAVDLQSWRVRAALEIVDGVRTGQPLGALLGYRFERGLHDAQLDVLVDDFRQAYPLPLAVGPDGSAEPPGSASIAARNVVDGQRLRHGDLAAGVADPLAGADAAQPGAEATIRRLIAELDEAVDAVADLLLAESVHHLVGGNPLRAGLSADAIGRGDGLPQELELVRTPRSATAVIHHVALLGPAGGSPRAAGWSDERALARLEPAIEGWCRERLGPAGAWRFGAATLESLGWCALDVVSTARPAPDDSPLARALRDAAGGADPDAGRLTELGLLCEGLRAVLATGTPLLASHLDPEAGDAWERADLAELGGRVRPWLDGVLEAGANLERALAADPPDAAAIGRALAALAQSGLGAALPLQGADPVAHGAQVRALLDGAGLAPLADPPSDPARAAEWARGAMAAVSAVLGDHVRVVPILRMALPSRTPADAGPDAVADWLRGVAPVRAATATLDEALVAAQVLAGAGAGELTAIQAPFEAGARWVATAPAVQGEDPERPRPPVRSTAVLHHDALGADEMIAGLVVDSWTEAIPRPAGKHGPEEIAGVAFHHDRPGARAPQALLLAVPPDLERGWRLEDVHGVVDETLRLARLRTLDLRDVADRSSTEPGRADLRRLLPVPGPL